MAGGFVDVGVRASPQTAALPQSNKLPVNLTAMADANNQNRQLFIMNFVNNAIRTDPNAAQSGIFSLERATSRWIYFELINRFDDAKPIFMGNFFMT